MRIRKTSIGRAEVAFLAIGGLFIGALGCKNDSGGAKTESSAKAEEGKKTETEQASEGPKVVPGPGYMPECFAPWSKDTKYFQWPAKKPPFRIALVNGYVGNAWRIQMVKTAKAFAKDPAIAPLIKEFKVVSTGTDIAAQLGSIEDFINQGFDGIVTLAVSPEGFDRVIRAANKKNVVIVPFDNVLDTDKVMQVNEDQLSMGKQWGEFLDKQLGGKGKVLEVRGLQGNSTERDRHVGFRQVMDAPGKKYEVIEVVGSWDDGKAQKDRSDPGVARREAQAHPRRDRSRERCAQAHCAVPRQRDEGHLARSVARARSHRDEGRDRRSPGQGATAEDLGAHPRRRRHHLEGRRQLLRQALGQLLHTERVSALRRQHLGREDHERVRNRPEIGP